ncbi:T9SS type A sorting domain-containing protein [Luteibaculum oceani]|uniref:T9SS type A sorting domain-containing protein n=1 Tax=Luteibaculum oceani TaxID=1294296 RepID=A0A5C6UWC4_9FLAO|nr:T9SS type A sorting domain-containing protein [Luteibaculum oceani]TXC76954.1 T9SS type A sorting domain-containing protein [Luteibaculum oceani]
MRSYKYIILIGILLSVGDLFSQLPIHKQWENIYGTHENEKPVLINDFMDGDFAILGLIEGGQTSDAYKNWFMLNSNQGAIKTSGLGNDRLRDIYKNDLGGLVFIDNGVCMRNDGNNFGDIRITYTDSSGESASSFCLGSTKDEIMFFTKKKNDKILIPANNFGGDPDAPFNNYGDADAWLIMLNSTGQQLWQNNFGGSKLDFVEYAEILDDKIIAIIRSFSDDYDLSGFSSGSKKWLLSIDEEGIILKSAIPNDPWVNEINAGAKQYFIDDKFMYIVGGRNGTNTSIPGHHNDTLGKDGFLTKVDHSTGEVIYVKYFGGTGEDRFFRILENNKGNLVICGKTNSSDGDLINESTEQGTWLLEVDPSGEIIDQNFVNYGLSGGSFVDFMCTQDDELIFLSTNKNKDAFPEYYGPLQDRKPDDYYVFKLGYSPVSSISNKEGVQSFSAYPNPNNTGVLNTNLKANYSLLDIQGRTLKSFVQSDALDVSDVQSGTYLVKHQSGATVRVVVK